MQVNIIDTVDPKRSLHTCTFHRCRRLSFLLWHLSLKRRQKNTVSLNSMAPFVNILMRYSKALLNSIIAELSSLSTLLVARMLLLEIFAVLPRYPQLFTGCNFLEECWLFRLLLCSCSCKSKLVTQIFLSLDKTEQTVENYKWMKPWGQIKGVLV